MIEFEKEAQLLINKHEKKIEWTRIEIVNLFNKVQSMKQFKSILDEDNVKLSVCEVSDKILYFLTNIFL